MAKINAHAPDDGVCYYDGETCDCGAFDVAGDRPRDPYVHDDDLISEDEIEHVYQQRLGANYDEEDCRARL